MAVCCGQCGRDSKPGSVHGAEGFKLAVRAPSPGHYAGQIPPNILRGRFKSLRACDAWLAWFGLTRRKSPTRDNTVPSRMIYY